MNKRVIFGLFLLVFLCSPLFAEDIWYKEELQKQGFFVLSKPVELEKIEVVGINGKAFNTEYLKGKIVFLNFWATWCGPCRMEMPSIQKLYESVKNKDFEILAIDVNEKPKVVKKFIEEKKYNFQTCIDKKGFLSSKYASNGIPSTYIVNKKGQIIASTIGARFYDSEEFIALMIKLAEEE